MSEQKNTSLSAQGQARSVFRYILKDPDTLQPRYVGKSIRPQQRLQNHYNEPPSNCHRSHWIQSLRAQGKRPLLEIVQEIEGGASWQESERLWIKCLRNAGASLTNNTDGGDGVVNLPPETRAKMRLTWLGRKHSPATLKKLSLRSRGRKHSDASKQRMRNLMRGRKILWIEKIAEANRKITIQQVREIEDRLALGAMGRDLAIEFKVHRTTISKIKMGTYFVGKLGSQEVREKLNCRKRAKFTPAQHWEVLQLLASGTSMRKTSKASGISTPVIRQMRDGGYFA